MACFNDVKVNVNNSILLNATVHGVCVRGDADVTLSSCRIEGCGARAAFVYQRGSLTLNDCVITKTYSKQTPAIQAESIIDTDNSKLNLRRCNIYSNEGPSLVINGKVIYDIEEGNSFDGLVEFNPDVTEATVPRPWIELQNEISSTN